MGRAVLALLLGACGGAEPDEPSDNPLDPGATDTAPPPDNWDYFASGFMQTYCVECHMGDGKDFRRYERVVAFAGAIRCGVTPTVLPDCTAFPPPGQFPVGSGPFPDDAERIRLVDWIDAGAPEGAP